MLSAEDQSNAPLPKRHWDGSPSRCFICTDMARDFSLPFYNSPAWHNCRDAYIKYRRGLCEVCLAKGIYKAGVIVHHKIHLTPNNIGDPNITTGFDNLQLLCRDCHADAHKTSRRYKCDSCGRVIATE